MFLFDIKFLQFNKLQMKKKETNVIVPIVVTVNDI